MRASRIVVGAMLACRLLIAGAIAPGPAYAQSDDEFVALNRQVHEMLQAGKYPEALQIAEHYVATARKRHGEEHPSYASALTSLGRVFQATNRLSEAEPLYRNSLAIDEKHLRPEKFLTPSLRLLSGPPCANNGCERLQQGAFTDLLTLPPRLLGQAALAAPQD
jgi:tetratricopeptide (TPR) repeat protein